MSLNEHTGASSCSVFDTVVYGLQMFVSLVLVPVIQLFRSVDRFVFISTMASASSAHAEAVSGTKLWLNMNCDKINDAIKFFLAHNYTTLYTILYETTLPSA